MNPGKTFHAPAGDNTSNQHIAVQVPQQMGRANVLVGNDKLAPKASMAKRFDWCSIDVCLPGTHGLQPVAQPRRLAASGGPPYCP